MINNFDWLSIIICLLGFGTPMGIVPGEEDPLLMRMAPENTVLYTSWAGTQEADPEGNPTEQWIAQKDMQRFWKDMGSRLQEIATKLVEQADNPVSGNLNALTVKLPKLLCRQPSGIYLDRIESEENKSTPTYGGLLAINLGDRKNEISEHLRLARESIEQNDSVTISREHEIDWLVSSNKWIKTKIGIHEQYLVIGFASGGMKPEVGSFFKNKDTPEPKWLTVIKEKLPVPRRASVGFIDFKKLNKEAQSYFSLENKSSDKLTTAGFVNGLDDEGYLGRTWLPGANESEFAKKLLNGPIDKDFLSKVPSADFFSIAARVSKEEVFDSIKSTIGNAGGSAKAFEESIAGFEAFAGLTLKQDLLNNLGDNVFVVGPMDIYSSRASCLCFEIKDDMAFLDTIDGFARRMKEVSEGGGSFDFKTKMIDDTKVHHVSLQRKWNSVKNIYFAQHKFRLIVGTDLQVFKQILSAEKSDEGDRWIETKRMQQLYEFARNQNLGEPQLIFEFDFKPIISSLVGFSNLFKGMGFAKVPNQATLENGLEPNLNAIFKREDGVEILQKHVMPSGNPISFVGFAGVISQTLDLVQKVPRN